MNKIRSIGLIILLLLVIVTGMKIHYSIQINDLKRVHQTELNILNAKHTTEMELVKKEYYKLETVYQKREEDNILFAERQKELMDNIQSLEEYIKDNSEVPGIHINKLESQWNKVVGEIYEETNNSTH